MKEIKSTDRKIVHMKNMHINESKEEITNQNVISLNQRIIDATNSLLKLNHRKEAS